MKPRRRAGRLARGGVGRALIARLTPAGRRDYLRRLGPAERKTTIAVAQGRPTPKPRALHEVSVRGIVAECTKCGWRGTADEAVSHVFGR